MHNFSLCVISGVKQTDIEKYRDSCTFFTMIFITLFAIMLMSSSQIPCDKYDVLPCPLFPYFSIWVAKNGSYLLKRSITPRKFPFWSEPIFSSCPRKAKPHILRKTMTSIIRRIKFTPIFTLQLRELHQLAIDLRWKFATNNRISQEFSVRLRLAVFVNFFANFPAFVESFSKLVICLWQKLASKAI